MMRIGDFSYVKEPMKLGMLKGNSFEITLREIDKPEDVIKNACIELEKNGFINYFGLQRFGKGGTKSHQIGRAIFSSDWKTAIDMLFTEREGDMYVPTRIYYNNHATFTHFSFS